MAATGTPTPNIGLRRAQGTDPASVDDINYNSALIDTKLGAVGNSSVQDQIDTLNSKIVIRKSNNISVQVPSSGSGTVSTSYQISPPQGYTLVSRAFMRTDDGGYGVIVYCHLHTNTILYLSTGSSPTLTGYVVDTWIKE